MGAAAPGGTTTAAGPHDSNLMNKADPRGPYHSYSPLWQLELIIPQSTRTETAQATWAPQPAQQVLQVLALLARGLQPEGTSGLSKPPSNITLETAIQRILSIPGRI